MPETPIETPFSNYVTSLIRTIVPVIVAYIATFAAKKFNIVLDEDAKQNATAAFTFVFFSAYYAAVRWAEKEYPSAGWFLGRPAKPKYKKG